MSAHRPSGVLVDARKPAPCIQCLEIKLSLRGVARPAGLEPATYGLEGRCTIQLCYGRRVRSIPPLNIRAK